MIDIPPIIMNTLVVLGIVIPLVAYSVMFFRRNIGMASNESNQILRGLIEDQKEELIRMRQRQHDTINEVTGLKLQLQHLADKRDYLEKLVITALRIHFENDPTIAEAVKTSVLKSTEAVTETPIKNGS